MKHKSPVNQPIAIIGGTSFMESPLFSSWNVRRIKTVHGLVEIREEKDVIFLQRHTARPVPPHMINHKANIRALKDLAVRKVVAINSVGSLRISLKPGMFIIPDDFIAIWKIPTFFDREMHFIVPTMDQDLRISLANLLREHRIKVRSGGVYIETLGPRLETKAEIALLKPYGHVVGMTMASEATLCMEYGIPYASLCCVDNYCNGILRVPLTMEQIRENVRKNVKTIEIVIESLVTRGIS
ncbi:MAG TPA: MTAP family purine nucleoside phosphorylase [Syntrophorhabdaceae bacterium]|nr:MTAP family purine nucleoside phosphorylase [Syntrophorhabdaceae bacterium]